MQRSHFDRALVAATDLALIVAPHKAAAWTQHLAALCARYGVTRYASATDGSQPDRREAVFKLVVRSLHELVSSGAWTE